MAQAFNVYKGSKLVDTVFYNDGVNISKEEVLKSLVEHDGYDSDIIVRKAHKKKVADIPAVAPAAVTPTDPVVAPVTV